MRDVNGTGFLGVLGESDWAPALARPDASDVDWNPRRRAVTLAPDDSLTVAAGVETLGPDDRRGAARDRFGNWYWIGKDEQTLYIRPPVEPEALAWWTPGSSLALQPEGGTFHACVPPAPPVWRIRGLAVLDDHSLVVGTLEPYTGLLVFDLHGGGPPVCLTQTSATPPTGPVFSPFAIAARQDGGFWVLGRDASIPGSVALWAFDRRLRLEQPTPPASATPTPEFTPCDPVTVQSCVVPDEFRVIPTPAAPLTLPHDAVSVTVLGDGTLLLLVVDATLETHVLHFDPTTGSTDLHSLSALLPGGAVWTGHDAAFIGRDDVVDPRHGTYLVVGRAGLQAVPFEIRPDGSGITVEFPDPPGYYPIRRFGGRAIVAAEDGAFHDLDQSAGGTADAVDRAARWVPLTEAPTPRYERVGTVVLGPFDGREPDCAWHRLFMDGRVPPGTRVEVATRAANSTGELSLEPWRDEPGLLRRPDGPELPYLSEMGQRAGTWELLFQATRGRLLELRITLHGRGHSTPCLHALRVYYPRFSYLERYLPAAYRDDATSASFVERYLANFEGMFTALEGRIANAQLLLDHRTVDAEYLDWLAGWLGVVMDPSFDEVKRRMFVEYAARLFPERGTLDGVLRMVRFVLDPQPSRELFADLDGARSPRCGVGRNAFEPHAIRIVEAFETRRRVPPAPAAQASLTVGRGSLVWNPALGAQPLHADFRRFLGDRYASDTEFRAAWYPTPTPESPGLAEIHFAPQPPSGTSPTADWRAFRDGLPFTYVEPTTSDTPLWQALLRARHRTLASVEQAHQRDYGSFDTIALPSVLPEAGRALEDWIDFVSLVLPIHRGAHRFTVYVPMALGTSEMAARDRIALVSRVVNAHKPAHAAFDVEPFWAAFRVGAARLGLDTLLERGSRYVPVELGSTHLARGYITGRHPWDVADRVVVGRDVPRDNRTI